MFLISKVVHTIFSRGDLNAPDLPHLMKIEGFHLLMNGGGDDLVGGNCGPFEDDVLGPSLSFLSFQMLPGTYDFYRASSIHQEPYHVKPLDFSRYHQGIIMRSYHVNQLFLRKEMMVSSQN